MSIMCIICMCMMHVHIAVDVNRSYVLVLCSILEIHGNKWQEESVKVSSLLRTQFTVL